MALNSLEGKLNIKPMKEEMNKIEEIHHEDNKRSLYSIIFGLNGEEELKK